MNKPLSVQADQLKRSLINRERRRTADRAQRSLSAEGEAVDVYNDKPSRSRGPHEPNGALASVAAVSSLSNVQLLRCELCQATFVTSSQMQQHLLSSVHQKAVMKQEAEKQERHRLTQFSGVAQAALAAAAWHAAQGNMGTTQDSTPGVTHGAVPAGPSSGPSRLPHSRQPTSPAAPGPPRRRGPGPQPANNHQPTTLLSHEQLLAQARAETEPLSIDGWVPPSLIPPSLAATSQPHLIKDAGSKQDQERSEPSLLQPDPAEPSTSVSLGVADAGLPGTRSLLQNVGSSDVRLDMSSGKGSALRSGKGDAGRSNMGAGSRLTLGGGSADGGTTFGKTSGDAVNGPAASGPVAGPSGATLHGALAGHAASCLPLGTHSSLDAGSSCPSGENHVGALRSRAGTEHHAAAQQGVDDHERLGGQVANQHIQQAAQRVAHQQAQQMQQLAPQVAQCQGQYRAQESMQQPAREQVQDLMQDEEGQQEPCDDGMGLGALVDYSDDEDRSGTGGDETDSETGSQQLGGRPAHGGFDESEEEDSESDSDQSGHEDKFTSFF